MKEISLISPDYQGHVDYTRHACRGIIVKDNKILLSYEKKNNKYVIPGGGVEENENYLNCLKREIKEETGYIVTSKESFLEIKEYFYWNKNWEHIQHYFICDIVAYENELNLTDREKEEGCTTKWVEIEKAIDIFSSYPSYLLADIAIAGLYKRELLALEEYLDLVKKNRKDFKGE